MDTSAQLKPIHGTLSQQQPPSIGKCESSLPCLSFSQKTAEARDVSFSSFLYPQLNNQVDDSEISIFDAQKYFNETSGSGDPRVSNRISPVEVISLESVPRFSTAASADVYARNYRARSFHATPTASSEASWNSQTGLLSNPPGAIAVSIQNSSLGNGKKKRSATKWFLGRKCPCAGKKSVQVGKKSVQVEEKLSASKTQPSHPTHKSIEPQNIERPSPTCTEKCFVATDWIGRQKITPNSHRISADNNHFQSTIGRHHVLASSIGPFGHDGNNGFTFPILHPSSSPIKLTLNGHTIPPLEDPARDSLEVFIPSEDVATSKTTTESFTVPTSPKSRMTAIDDDLASDASSDLFEIESFSTQTTYQMYNTNRRDSMDEISSNSNGRSLYCRHSLEEIVMTPHSGTAQAECYEPSEASIDWSVTTAEAFERGSMTNFSVAASEIDRENGEIGQYDMLKTNSSSSRGWRKRGGGSSGLLSCRHEKAVSVEPQPIKWGGTQGQRGGENSTVRHVSSRPPVANKPQFQLARSRSHSAHLPLPFAP